MNCPHCQTVNQPAAKFCMNCGQPLAEALSRAAPPHPSQQTPQDYLAKMEAVRASRSMAGERRIVTMLFCDVKGSTAAAEQLDPEEWTDIMNGAFEYLIAPVYRYEGTLARLMGDAILAFFGAPLAHEDDPQRAVLAGLDILRDIQPYCAEVKRRWQLDFAVRVGINTGLVVVGMVGSDLRMEYTAQGDAINLAARMEQTAAPGTVQISANTHKLIEPLFGFEDLGQIELKGKSEPVQVYRVLGPKAKPGRLRGLDRRGLTSALVGREAEFATLRDCLARLADGEGRLALILGEAGLGKSRLIAEIRRDALAEPFRWLEGRTLSFGQKISYWPFQDILRQYAGIADDDGEADAWRKLESRMATLFGEQIAEILPYLAGLLKLEVRGDYAERVKYLDGEAMGRQVFLASRRFFERLAQTQPVVLVFEDLHWADESSALLLEHLLPLAARAPILFLCLSRPEPGTPGARLADIAAKEYAAGCVEIRLAPLSENDSSRLVRNLLEIEGLPIRLREMIVRKAEGNPFFLEEVIRTLIDDGAIVRDPQTARWQATAQIESVTVPDTLQGVILARVDRLADDVKHVLRTAAVIGQSFLYQVLQAVAQSEEALDRHLHTLQSVELIREKQRLPELEYVFKHALAQEAAYASLLLQRRRELHARVGAAIEGLFADRLEEFYGLLAYHFARAEAWDKAQEYLLRAGDQAGSIAADAEAVAHYQQAMTAYIRAFGDRWDPFQRAVLERKMGEAHFRLGEHAQASEYLERALNYLGQPMPVARPEMRRAILLEVARLIGRRLLPGVFLKPLNRPAAVVEEESRLYWVLVWIAVFQSNAERILLSSLRMLNVSERANYSFGIAMSSSGLGFAADFIPLFGLAAYFHRRALTAAAQSQHLGAIGIVFQNVALHEYFVGEAGPALEHARRSADVYRKFGDLRGWGAATMFITYVLVDRGEYTEALQLAAELIQIGQAGGGLTVWRLGEHMHGYAQRRMGAIEAARVHLQKAVELAERIPDHLGRTEDGGELARCYLRLGQLPQALMWLESSEQVAVRHGVRSGPLAIFRNAAAEVYLAAAEQSSESERAEWMKKAGDACRVALRQAKAMRPLVPEARRFMGTYEWLRGNPASALQWWRRSLSLAEAIGNRHDAAMAHLEIGRRSGDSAHLERAATLSAEIGATLPGSGQ